MLLHKGVETGGLHGICGCPKSLCLSFVCVNIHKLFGYFSAFL